eukprot:CAMPEP_0168388908 /NCGR_PEP_ID=MMETSP0228-20121227/16693_1 /TAXON_ID=133427 /ORGANISM="Protoceratium reticulatum, Strain CCCM 535 (=CCMP 1889)" /LENGTH=52 /DNA_ID=CAMNT_0008402169 /DNA_START=439 /DNA_END=595 /DNA_ORIENTATION=+
MKRGTASLAAASASAMGAEAAALAAAIPGLKGRPRESGTGTAGTQTLQQTKN